MSPPISESFYLVLSLATRGYGLQGRLTARSPTLKRGEIAMQITVKVPRALFAQPTLRASIEIPDDQAPTVITAEVAENMAEIIRQQTGMAVVIEQAQLSDDTPG